MNEDDLSKLDPHMQSLLIELQVMAEEDAATDDFIKTIKEIGEYVEIDQETGERSAGQEALEKLVKSLPLLLRKAEEIISDKWEEMARQNQLWQEEKKSLLPFLKIELKEAAKENPELKDITPEDVIRQVERSGFDPESQYTILLNSTRERLKEAPRVKPKKTETMPFPLDKINTKIWTVPKEAYIEDVLRTTDSRKDATVYFSIDFSQMEDSISGIKRLTPYDRRVYNAAASVYASGNEFATIAMIYRAMTGKDGKNISSNQTERIFNSLKKMQSAPITLSDIAKAGEDGNSVRFGYQGNLLYCEMMPAFFNDKLAETAIHFLKEPPLLSFSKKRGEITTIKNKLLESAMSITDDFIALDDYLIAEIAHMKHRKGKGRSKISYSSIFDKCGIESRKQQSRLKPKILQRLEEYKGHEWIKSYSVDADGVSITP